MDAKGQFLVVWDQWDGIQQNRYIRKFNKQGQARSRSVRLNNFQTTLAYSGLPDVDMNDRGDVIVAWGEDFMGFDQVRPMVSINAQGDALISWTEQSFDGQTRQQFVYTTTYDAVNHQ